MRSVMFITGRQTASNREDAQKDGCLAGAVLTEEEKMQGQEPSPGSYREVFEEIAFHAAVLSGHGGAQEAPLGSSATCPHAPTAAEEPSRRTTNLRGDPRWIPPAVRAGMAFLAQQLSHATRPSVLSLLSCPPRCPCPTGSLAVPCFGPVVIGDVENLVRVLHWHNLVPFACCKAEEEFPKGFFQAFKHDRPSSLLLGLVCWLQICR